MSTTSAIPQGSTVLVTGVNSFIGSHVADQLLNLGYKVRGTARDASKVKWVQDLFDKKYGPGKFEGVIVPSMSAEGAFDEAAKGVSGVAHIAANLSFSPDPNVVIPDTVNGALNALRAAAKQPTVKRVVVTSSSSAVLLAKPNVSVEITPEMYNEEAIQYAWAAAKNLPAPHSVEAFQLGAAVYAASKAEAEKACWKFVEEEKPGFEFNTVLPNSNFGPVLDKEHRSVTAEWVGWIMKGSPEAEHMHAGLNASPQHFVDVRDTARLHVAALTNPDVKSERIFAFAAPFAWSDIHDILRKAYPDRNIPPGSPDDVRDLTRVKTRARSVELLKTFGRDEFVSLEESVKANAEAFI